MKWTPDLYKTILNIHRAYISLSEKKSNNSRLDEQQVLK